MSTQFLLHQDGKWLSFEGGAVKALESRPRIDRSTVVITDFDGAVSEVTSLEGSATHAVALIERRLRADGLIDGDSKILIHQVRTVGNGYQALFTAVPLDRWQQMFAWADNQDDHCLLVPTVALLWKMLRPGRGVVLHSGRKVVFLAALRNSIVYSSALAFSDSRDDLSMTVAALGERAGRLLSAGDEVLEPLSIEWIGTLTHVPQKRAVGSARVREAGRASVQRADPVLDRWPTPDETPTERTRGTASAPDAVEDDPSMSFEGQDEYVHDVVAPIANDVPETPVAEVRAAPPASTDHGGALDEQLLEIFAANSGATVTLAPHATVTGADGLQYRSGIPRLMQAVSAGVAVNSAAARTMYVAERILPWASAASLALALGLAALGGRWTLAAHEASERADALQSEIEALDTRTAELEPRQAMPADYSALLDFISRATGLSQALDPAATLLTVRRAAGADVRVLRLRLDTAVEDRTSLRIDGVVNYAAGRGIQDQGQQVARFVQRLRDAGYVPVAIDPQAGNSGAGAPGGLFSYQLTRAQAAPAAGVSL